jgi:hypothetical protein
MMDCHSPYSELEEIQKFFPFIPLKIIPRENGRDTCSGIEEAFFAIRELIRDHTWRVYKPGDKLPGETGDSK